MTRGVERALGGLAGVRWAEVDPVLRRVVVQPEAAGTGPPGTGQPVIDQPVIDQLIGAVESVEVACGVGDARFDVDAAGHPGDREPVVRNVVALGADVAGLGLGVVGRVLRATPLPVEAASVVGVVDNEPRIRYFLESHVGTASADLGLAVANAVGQGLSQGPLGLIADGMHRVNLLLEATARREAFARAEGRRWADGPVGTGRGQPPVPSARPVPLPGGPVELYSDRALLGGLGAAAVTFAGSRSPRRAAAMALAAVPKAARLGRESFAAHLDRALSDRDLLVLDADALRRLDRVDTVVVDGALLATGRSSISGLRLLEGADAPDVARHLNALFDPLRPTVPVRRGRWDLSPPDAAESRRAAVRLARAGLDRHHTLLLRCAGRPVAVVGIGAERSAPAVHLVRSARRHGHMVAIAASDAGVGPEADGDLPDVHVADVHVAGGQVAGVHVANGQVADCDLIVPGGDGLAASVRQLQHDGCVVAIVASGGPDHAEALGAADVGVEVPSLDGSTWSGDIAVNEVDDAAFILDAIVSAREVSRQSVALSATGSGIGALLSIGGLPGRAAGRATGAVNLAALGAMANGIRAVGYLRRHGGQVPGDSTPWHELSAEAVLDRLGTTPAGLSVEASALRRQDSTGVRSPEPALGRSILGELANPLTPILAGGAVASAAVGAPADAGIVAGVSALNALIGGVQHFRAEKAIVSLTETSQTLVTVLRRAQLTLEPADRLVPGDVVVLRSGDSVPADCRILVASLLEVDESTLTGESEAVGKDTAPTYSAILAERSSMLYEGTTIVTGEATAVVVAVGPDTAANAMLHDLPPGDTTVGVEARLRTLTSLTIPVAGAGGASVLGLGLLRGRSFNQSVGSAVALAVAAVPEGLPVLATMAQLASARRLSRRQALVRNPRAIEALGRVRVLCTDKTGTLTEGRIRLRAVSDGTVEAPVDRLTPRLAEVVGAGLRASPGAGPSGSLPHLTDRAVVAGAHACGVDTATGAPEWVRRAELPFEPTRGYHATVGSTGAETAPSANPPGANPPSARLLSVKGAPETVLPRCVARRAADGDVAMGPAVRRRLDQEVDRLARQGLRILAVAETAASPGDDLGDEDITDLTFLGFLILSDPMRATAAQAVQDLRSAGVAVLMVTGDHPSTAEGIAAELGILEGRRVVTGTELAAMTDPDLDRIITGVSLFARVTPADKVRVVLALQRQGAPVAMTGDGANDAPAILLADVGIALGDHATPAARRAADVIVTDERIETIVDAIIEGRAMWASLRDALAILLGGNVGEVIFTVGATAVTGRAPLSARQLLVVNLLTDVAPALAIALRPPSTDTPEALVAEGPDASLGKSLERAIAVRATTTALAAGLAWTAASATGRPRRAGTTALVALVGSQLAQTLVIGGRDPSVVVTGLGSAAVLAAIVQTPGVSQFFGCTPLGPIAWSIALTSSGIAAGASTAATWAWRRREGAALERPELALTPGDSEEGKE